MHGWTVQCDVLGALGDVLLEVGVDADGEVGAPVHRAVVVAVGVGAGALGAAEPAQQKKGGSHVSKNRGGPARGTRYRKSGRHANGRELGGPGGDVGEGAADFDVGRGDGERRGENEREGLHFAGFGRWEVKDYRLRWKRAKNT